MSVEQQQRKLEIFNTAAELSDLQDRLIYLQQACRGDEQLRAEILELLQVDQEDGGILDQVSPRADAQDSVESWTACGEFVGCYRLLENLGEGGMGAVFKAEQTRPVVRTVAVKIIKPGMDTRQVIARFEAERQALAMMDHPNISKVLDAGTTENGRPYFVMELVCGTPITEYCDDHLLGIDDRLRLFIDVCHAIQHAHQKGIIHRDMKPNNVLVARQDGQAVPKIIDFGVAKATRGRLTDKTLITEEGHLIGTVEYMSPEQARLNTADVDTRSDIYSLGVLLYELLGGEVPFDQSQLRSVAFDEMLRIVRENEPPAPSKRFAASQQRHSIAKRRNMEPKQLDARLKGELDWIVLRALEKDRSQRYEHATALADDLKRYLLDEPVAASPPSTAYRMGKLLRRYKWPAFTAVSVVAVLVASTITSTLLALRAGRAEQLADMRLSAEQAARKSESAALQNVREANERAKNRLFDSLLAQAQAVRQSGTVGQRLQAIDTITQATKLNAARGANASGRLQLRNEVIAALALPDLRKHVSWLGLPNTESRHAIGPGLTRYAFIDQIAEPLAVEVRTIGDSSQLFSLPLTARESQYLLFSDAERYLAVRDGSSVSVWDVASQMAVLQDLPCSRMKGGIDFDVAESLFACGQANGAVRVYDLESRQIRFECVPDKTAAVRVLKLSDDGQKLAVAFDGEDEIYLWDLAKGQIERKLVVSAEATAAIAWDLHANRIATGGQRLIDVWDLADEGSAPTLVLEGHDSLVISIAFDHSGKLLASYSWDGTLRLWNAERGNQLLHYGVSLQGTDSKRRNLLGGQGLELAAWEILTPDVCRWLYRDRVFGLDVSSDGNLLALAFSDGVRLVDLHTFRELRFLESEQTYGVRFHPQTGHLITSGRRGVLRWPIVWESEDQAMLRVGSSSPWTTAISSPSDCWLSQDGSRAVFGHGRATDYGPPLRMYQASIIDLAASPDSIKMVNKPYLCGVAISPDGRWVATGNKWGHSVVVWDADSAELVCELETRGTATAAFSPDNRWLVTNSGDAVRFWRVGSWEVRHELPSAARAGGAIAFTVNSEICAVARYGQGITLVDMDTFSNLASLPEHAGQPRHERMCFSPTADHLVVALGERGICIWDLRRIRKELASSGLDWGQSPSLNSGQVQDVALEH